MRNGVIVLLASALGLWFCLTHSLPLLSREHGRVVRAEFANVNQVDTRTPVRVGGVDVGKVEKIQLQVARHLAVVTMRITDRGVTVRRDAKAGVRWRNMLGGRMYIELRP